MKKKNKIQIKKQIEAATEGMNFVFDRISECEIDENLTCLSVYGWIKNDFVVFLCDITGKDEIIFWNVTTSSKKYSKILAEKIYGGVCKHSPCQLFEKWIEVDN